MKTGAAHKPMSALGQKQTRALQKVMSALPPKADMCGATRHVRFVPIADIALFIRSLRRRAAEATT
ncbi:MAG: hypothetical protein WAN68_11485, partial [Pseudolabrys sp.]